SGVFAGIAHTPGFVSVIASFLFELKQDLIKPPEFFTAAASDKERELATIYAAYQRILQQNDLVDREGEGWLALDALDKNPALAASVDLLIADGYDQFNIL